VSDRNDQDPSAPGRRGQVLDVLSAAECLRLAAATPAGRIAVMGDDPDLGPLVVPVNHRVDGRDIVFRTRPGTVLAAMDGAPASFQADWTDPLRQSGWSVLFRGWARRVPVHEADDLGVVAWVGDAADHAVRLTPTEITGRRLRGEDLARDRQGYL
jgi:hypothetical protein